MRLPGSGVSEIQWDMRPIGIEDDSRGRRERATILPIVMDEEGVGGSEESCGYWAQAKYLPLRTPRSCADTLKIY